MKIKAKYLLDTNVLSEPAKPKPNREFLRRFEHYFGQLAIASVTWHEALYGLEILPQGWRKRAVLEYLHALALPVLPYDERAAEWFAKERARLKRAGKQSPYADGQIAAIAAVNDLVLVTANGKDFRSFEGLAIADWLS